MAEYGIIRLCDIEIDLKDVMKGYRFAHRGWKISEWWEPISVPLVRLPEYGIVCVCKNEMDFKDFEEKSPVCAQRLKNVQMVGAYQSTASPSWQVLPSWENMWYKVKWK